MAGKARTTLLDHSSSLVEGSAAGSSWAFLYQASIVKHPNYNIGDRIALPDGRVFRYGRMGTVRGCASYHGAGNESLIAHAYTVSPTAQNIGDMEIVITATGFTADQLRGGYAVIYGGSDAVQQRGIVGNDASGTSTTKIYLDGPLATAIVAATTGVEVFHNPYAYLGRRSDTAQAVMGVPAVNAAVSQYVWLQTWGPATISAGEDVTTVGINCRNLVFAGSGNLFKAATFPSAQVAGFMLEKGLTADGPMPQIMLQISP